MQMWMNFIDRRRDVLLTGTCCCSCATKHASFTFVISQVQPRCPVGSAARASGVWSTMGISQEATQARLVTQCYGAFI